MKKYIIKGQGKNRLELNRGDILLLAWLAKQQVLKTDQLYKLYTEYIFEKIELNPYSFKNRLRKFEKYKLVRSAKFAEGFTGDRFKYYTVGAAGVELLIKEKLLPKDFNKKSIYNHLKKENILHFLGAGQAAINIICATADLENRREYVSLPPSQHRYEEWIPNIRSVGPTMNRGAKQAATSRQNWSSNYKKPQGKWMTIVRPDWIIHKKTKGRNDRYLNIEFDTGSESLETLQEKIWRYQLLAENRPNEKHILLFVLPDKTFSKHYNFKQIDKRIEKIFDLLATEENTKRSVEVNLTACVVQLDLAGYLGFQLLTALFENEVDFIS
ncbi:replication-relaxation family protein [Metabacillus fastidiosus]|uniref:replication-relaxation family protein n=1 Tax=Metabacillus fastidiosus TaxID=1458 RepID=UPI003D2CF3CF